jgi:hypothetical protein
MVDFTEQNGENDGFNDGFKLAKNWGLNRQTLLLFNQHTQKMIKPIKKPTKMKLSKHI